MDKWVSVGEIKYAKKKGAVPNQRGFRGLKKGFVLSTELINSFAHSTKP
jgi:hypothetical protein